MIHYYGRVSTDHQENSAEHQRAVFERLGAEGGEEYRVWIDSDVSGEKPMRHRPQGKRMWDLVQPGDMVVVTKLDRGWRSVEDAAHTLKVLRQMGIRLKILDAPVDVSTDEGEMMFHMLANFAQYDNRLRGRRVRDGFAHRRKSGLPYGISRPLGWKRRGNKYVELPEERAIADLCAELYAEGHCWNAISRELHRRRITKPTFHKRQPGYWKPRRSWYGCEEVKLLIVAREAGYPTVARSRLLDFVREQNSA